MCVCVCVWQKCGRTGDPSVSFWGQPRRSWGTHMLIHTHTHTHTPRGSHFLRQVSSCARAHTHTHTHTHLGVLISCVRFPPAGFFRKLLRERFSRVAVHSMMIFWKCVGLSGALRTVVFNKRSWESLDILQCRRQCYTMKNCPTSCVTFEWTNEEIPFIIIWAWNLTLLYKH